MEKPNIEVFTNSVPEQVSKMIEEIKNEKIINKDFEKDTNNILTQFKSNGICDANGNFMDHKMLKKGSIAELKTFSRNNPNIILEVADNGARKLHRRMYDGVHYDYVRTESKTLSAIQRNVEFAEDDRVLGIPYAQAMAGDRVYIINGKIFTGWALYFSLSSIKSPENYGKNIDLIYNISYLFASILLKAQLGLGIGFDVNYGSEELEVPEEKLIRRYLFDELRINTQKLTKTGFHLYSYGNAYWALRRNANGLVDKITLLQPERLKIFLDPMTTKVLFYIYLPPIIGGTTIASYPSDGRYNPNILTGVTLSYPTPIVMSPEDIIHFKINDFTEYPFGFSDVRSCIDPASARLDINILAPIIFKKYTKPMIHWSLDDEGLGPKQIEDRKDEMIEMLQTMEPGSDPVTTKRWTANAIDVGQNKNDIFALAADMDTQIFAATGAPETYFKPKGSTDRMISEQDKTFISRMKIPQSIVAEEIEIKLINPRIDFEIKRKQKVKEYLNEKDAVDGILFGSDSYMAPEPKYPKVQWHEIFKQDETQSIANSIALLNAGVIDRSRAATKVGEKPMTQQVSEDQNKIGIDDPLSKKEIDPFELYKAINQTPEDYNSRNNMELLRGSLNVTGQKADFNRNIQDVKDPTKLGGSLAAEQNMNPMDKRKEGRFE